MNENQKYYAAAEALLDDERELYRVYIGIGDPKKKKLHSAVYGNTPATAIHNAEEVVAKLNQEP